MRRSSLASKSEKSDRNQMCCVLHEEESEVSVEMCHFRVECVCGALCVITAPGTSPGGNPEVLNTVLNKCEKALVQVFLQIQDNNLGLHMLLLVTKSLSLYNCANGRNSRTRHAQNKPSKLHLNSGSIPWFV